MLEEFLSVQTIFRAFHLPYHHQPLCSGWLSKSQGFMPFFVLNIHTKVIVTVNWWSFKIIFKVMIFFSLYVKLMSNTVCLIIMDMQVNANQWPPLFLISCQKLTIGRLLSLLLQMSTYRNILIDPLNKIIQTKLKGVFCLPFTEPG